MYRRYGGREDDELMQTLARVLDAESYEWLGGHHPDVLEAIEKEVSASQPPRDIKQFVMMHTLRPELAQRCYQAARHILRQQEQ